MVLTTVLFSMALASVALAARRPNVLMIAVDDLRTEIEAYPEGAHMHTPNLKKLAAESMVFERAYVSVALCSPSRTSLLTSRRADTTRVWVISDNEYWRHRGCNATTLPQTFKLNGFQTIGMGKVFHEGLPSGNQDVAYSWSPSSLPFYDPPGQTPGKPKGTYPMWFKVDDDAEPVLQDGNITNHAVETIYRLGNESLTSEQPFFLAVGLHKPHVPWYVPQSFWDLYPNDTVTLAPHNHLTVDVPEIALQSVMKSWIEQKYPGHAQEANLTADYPFDNTTLPDELARNIRQAYWAATSWTDMHIGKVLQALEDTGLRNDTIIALWGDHGYQLQDNNQWAKQTNYEQATRIPMMISAPTLPGFQPGRSPALVEEVDIFPTLVELAVGMEVPPCSHNVTESRQTSLCTEGFSLVPLLTEPDSQWRPAAFSQYARVHETIMGYTVRVNDYRYTSWVGFNRTTATPAWDDVHGTELYDHSDSPVPVSFGVEHTNLANNPAYADVKSKLHAVLLAGWRKATVPPAEA